jgi:O-acetyl-ADP-ribose deacetylase (regulator of RNase III)
MDVIDADITTLNVDAIVNAANQSLLGGAGVDGAIHRAAGPELLEECRRIPQSAPGVRCPTGQARLTRGYDLPARFIIHTVGPVWHGGADDEQRLLADCYRNSLLLASEHAIRSIAFPAISTGVYRFPLPLAAEIAVGQVRDFLADHALPQRVIFACFGVESANAFKAALGRFRVP